MDGFAASTIAALLYSRTPVPSVSELARALSETFGIEPLPCRAGGDGCARFDLPDRRVGLIEAAMPHATAPQGPAPRALLVIVGDLPQQPGFGGDHQGLCEALARRIEAGHPADGLVLAEVDGLSTAADIDRLLETVLVEYAAGATPDAPIPPEPVLLPPPAPAARRKRRLGLLDLFQPQTLSPILAARFDHEIARRSALHDAPKPTAPRPGAQEPSLTPPRPQPLRQPARPARSVRASAVFARLRGQPALDDDTLFPSPEAARARPLVHRSAIHALNLATLAFALPIGAFLMILALFGRESIAMSARMTAVTGAGIGIAQDPGVAQFVANLL